MPDSTHALVIGGGISGLVCAWRLQQLGVHTTLLEAESRSGGLVGTVEQDGFLFESGPQSFLGTEALLQLIRDVGIESELCQANPRAPRFILRHGKLCKIPMSPALLTSSLLGARSRWKIVSEPFRRTRPPSREESVSEFVRRKFGNEILEYLVAPFISGVYAGDPEKLSLRAVFPSLEEWEREYGSVFRGAIRSRPAKPEGARKGPPPLCSFQRGVETLTRTLAAKLGDNLSLKTRANALSAQPGGERRIYQVSVVRNNRDEKLQASAVVLATPAHVASRLAAPLSQALGSMLSGIVYAAVGVVAAGYYARQTGQSIDGFGFLIPRAEKVRTLGTVWNSSLFPGRAGDGRVALTSFIGGATDPEAVNEPADVIAAIVERENAKILEISGPPITTSVWKHPKALPQYNLGHGHIVEAIREAERAIPGLFFSGNYLHGPSLGKCVEQALETAETVHAYLHAKGNP